MDPHQDTVSTKRPLPTNADEVKENSDSKNDVSSNNPLELMKDFVEEPSSSIKIVGETTIKPSQITLNGEPLVALSTQDDEVRSVHLNVIKSHRSEDRFLQIFLMAFYYLFLFLSINIKT